MEYDSKLWDKYTNENKENFQNEISTFIYFMCLGLGSRKICEAGCNIGNNLSRFPENFSIYGIDMNKHALQKAQEKYPKFIFQHENIKKTSFSDSLFDLVFTRGVLIHMPTDDVDDVLQEFLRISKKWIFNLEYYGKDEKMINWKRGENLLWYRNLKERWKKFEVRIVSDVDIPLEVDPGKMRFTLIEKMVNKF